MPESPQELVEICRRDNSAIPQIASLALKEVVAGRRDILDSFKYACYQDMPLFSEFFFSQRIYGGVTDFHREFYDAYKSGYGQHSMNIIWPRGTAKTSVCAIMTPLHGIAYFDFLGWRNRIPARMTGHPYTVITSESRGLSESFLRDIKTELQFNELYCAAFAPPGCKSLQRKEKGFLWNVDEILCANWAYVRAAGNGSQIRGRIHLGLRPTLIIVDDPEGERTTGNIDIIKDTRDWFYNAVRNTIYKSATYQGRVIVVGTVVHEHCLVNFIRKNDKSFTTTFKTIIVTNEKTGKEESLWENERPLVQVERERKEAERAGRLSGWLQENMNEPMAKSEKPFNPDTFKWWKGTYHHHPDHDMSFIHLEYIRYADGTKSTEKVGGNGHDINENFIPITVYIGVDPAAGDTVRSCFNVVMVIGLDAHANMYILEYWRVRTSIASNVVEKILDLAKTYHAKKVVIETTGYQHTLYAETKRKAAEREIWSKIAPELQKNTGTKDERIEMLEPRFSSGRMHFADVGMTALISELHDFPQSEHKDCLDALWLAVTGARRCPHKSIPMSLPLSAWRGAPVAVANPLTMA
ncbi:MAG TPA: hypothetical protein ENH84_01775 [Phycisphaerae bacterium]|nr:hypothetical protein [Phycisphaerae bacterium]